MTIIKRSSLFMHAVQPLAPDVAARTRIWSFMSSISSSLGSICFFNSVILWSSTNLNFSSS